MKDQALCAKFLKLALYSQGPGNDLKQASETIRCKFWPSLPRWGRRGNSRQESQLGDHGSHLDKMLII